MVICHSWVPGGSRLGTGGSQGQAFIRLPKGFAIPVLSTEPIQLTSQALNLNPFKEPVSIRHKGTINYIGGYVYVLAGSPVSKRHFFTKDSVEPDYGNREFVFQYP
jgi:hypothetical protein